VFFSYGVIYLLTRWEKFYCDFLLLGSNNCSVQTAFVKTSISMPLEMLEWAKARSREEGSLPVSRIITQAIREKMASEAKSKTKGRASK
jgi:hypothetical protein